METWLDYVYILECHHVSSILIPWCPRVSRIINWVRLLYLPSSYLRTNSFIFFLTRLITPYSFLKGPSVLRSLRDFVRYRTKEGPLLSLIRSDPVSYGYTYYVPYPDLPVGSPISSSLRKGDNSEDLDSHYLSEIS